MIAAIAILTLVGACSKPAQPVQGSQAEPAAMKGYPPRLPPKPGPTIDPRSPRAALELAGSFARLINSRQFGDAYMLLGARAPERREFDLWFKPYKNLEARVGEAGGEEGAAGSVYISVPLTLFGDLDNRRLKRSATIIFRRVNDVPGSTEAERRWHIERIDWPS